MRISITAARWGPVVIFISVQTLRDISLSANTEIIYIYSRAAETEQLQSQTLGEFLWFPAAKMLQTGRECADGSSGNEAAFLSPSSQQATTPTSASSAGAASETRTR